MQPTCDAHKHAANADTLSTTSDAYWSPDLAHMDEMRQCKPWRHEPRYFRRVCMSALAALKMFVHATAGSPDHAAGRHEWFEVMGLMLGHYKDDTLIVLDSFGLPVDASEVECSMNERSQVYMVEYMDYYRRVGKPDRGCVGWYHTHPGYSCFLSGIDVNTQQQSQRVQDPWLAVVLDPVSTISSGKLDVKAFRVLPDTGHTVRISAVGERSAATTSTSFDRVSSQLVRDYGVYAHRYYELPITIVRSRTDAAQLDALMRQYWPLTFTTNPLLVNRDYHAAQMAYVTHLLRASAARDGDSTTTATAADAASSADDTPPRRAHDTSRATPRHTLAGAALYDDCVGARVPSRGGATGAAAAAGADADYGYGSRGREARATTTTAGSASAVLAKKAKHDMLSESSAAMRQHAAHVSVALAKDMLLDSLLLSLKARVFRAPLSPTSSS